MADNKFSAGPRGANSEDEATAFRGQLLTRALAQQLVAPSDPSTSATLRMEQSMENIMEQLQIIVRLSRFI